MRRVSQLITQVRRETENQKTGINDGISDLEFIDFANDAQDEILAAIYDAHPTTFHKQITYDTARDVDTYTMPSDLYIRSRLVGIEYSNTGDPKHFRHLQKMEPRERRGEFTGLPQSYFQIADTVVLFPSPQFSRSDNLRITYDPILPRLDTRQSIVQSFNITAGVLDALDLDETFTDFDNTNFEEFDSLCLVDRDGNIKMADIKYELVDASGTVTLTGGGHTLLTGETIAAGDYIARGSLATNRSDLPDETERFLKAYMGYRVFLRDSSTDAEKYLRIVEQMKGQIVAKFAILTDDVDAIPVTDWEYHPDEEFI